MKIGLRCPRAGAVRRESEPAGNFRLTLTTITDDDIDGNARFGSLVATQHTTN